MALLENGILGPFTGKCGTVIGYLRNGVPCIRSMPTHYHDRRSEKQLQNRSRFTLVMKMMSLVRPAIMLGFRHFATDMTEMNQATRANYYSLVKGQNKHLHYDYSGLILSQGPVEPLADLIMTTHGTTLTLLWNSQSIPGGSQDKLSVLLLNTDKRKILFLHEAALREQGTLSLTLPPHWNSDSVYCYAMVQRNSEWSDSSFVGKLQDPTNQYDSLTPQQLHEKELLTHHDTPSSISHQTPVKVLSHSPRKGTEKPPSKASTIPIPSPPPPK